MRDLDAEVARVDGHGFVVTPFATAPPSSPAASPRAPSLGERRDGQRLGVAQGPPPVRAADPSRGRRPSRDDRGPAPVRSPSPVVATPPWRPQSSPPPVAAVCSSSCPTDAEPAVLSRLRALGAEITVCEREEGVAGRPDVSRPEKGDRKRRLAVHLPGQRERPRHRGRRYARLRDGRGSGSERGLDDVVVQVGGGALASGVAQGLARRPPSASFPPCRACTRSRPPAPGRSPGRCASSPQGFPASPGRGGGAGGRCLCRIAPFGVHVALGDGAAQPGPRDPRRRDLRLARSRRGDASQRRTSPSRRRGRDRETRTSSASRRDRHLRRPDGLGRPCRARAALPGQRDRSRRAGSSSFHRGAPLASGLSSRGARSSPAGAASPFRPSRTARGRRPASSCWRTAVPAAFSTDPPCR